MITLSTGTKVDLKASAAFADLTEAEFRELVTVVKHHTSDFCDAIDRAVRGFEKFEPTVSTLMEARDLLCGK